MSGIQSRWLEIGLSLTTKMMRVQRTPVTVAPATAGIYINGADDIVVIVFFGIGVFLINCAANIINDIRDVKVDRLASPDRPLVQEIISMKSATIIAFTFVSVGILIFWRISWVLGVLTSTIGIIYLLSYDLIFKMKKYPASSFLYITFSTSTTPFILSAIAVGNLDLKPIWIGLLLSTFTCSSILGSLRDVYSDAIMGKNTVAVKLGIKTSGKMTALLMLAPLPVYPLLPILLSLSQNYLLLCIVSASLRARMAYSIWRHITVAKARRLSPILRGIYALDFTLLAIGKML